MKRRYKVMIVGAFDPNGKVIGGQTVKTRELYGLMIDKFGERDVVSLDTIEWKKHPIILFLKFFFLSFFSDSIIMLPAHKGVQVFSRLLVFVKKMLGIKIYYDVIGAWLPNKLKNNHSLYKILTHFDGIWAETNSMMSELEKQGYNNVYVINNFKKLVAVDCKDIMIDNSTPIKLCTFSRVLKEKGIEDAIDAVTSINEKYGEVKFSLDIYGPIDADYEISFNNIQAKFPSYVKYRGVVDANDSVAILKNYSLLLFPTHYDTEGIPGSIIDAYFAGLPIIAARWQSFSDVIDEGITGFGYKIRDNNDLIKVLESLLADTPLIEKCRYNCIRKAHEYTPDYVFNQIMQTGF